MFMLKKLKIITIMAVALGISSAASNTVFIAATPYINKPFLAQAIRSPGMAFQSTKDYIAAIGKGRAGVESYQKGQVEYYASQQQANQASLPPPTSGEDFLVQGYTQTATGVYGRTNTSAGTIEIYFTEDARFEKRTIEMGGESVEAWVPL